MVPSGDSTRDDLDGLCTANISDERASELWGLNPRWSGGGDAAQCIIEATLAINAGLCTTVALVYGNAQRSMTGIQGACWAYPVAPLAGCGRGGGGGAESAPSAREPICTCRSGPAPTSRW
jgi:hypothetical protein